MWKMVNFQNYWVVLAAYFDIYGKFKNNDGATC